MIFAVSFLVALHAIALVFVFSRLHALERNSHAPVDGLARADDVLRVTDRLGERVEVVEDLVGSNSPFALKRRKNKAIRDRVEVDE